MEKRDLDIVWNSAVNWQMYRDKTVLVTGATGRLGRYFFETLINIDLEYNLNMRIIGVVRSEKKAKDIFGSMLELPNVLIICQDINIPIDYSNRIDYIIHTAGPAAPVNFKNNPCETLWAHVNGTHNILECARKHQTIKVFYVSTAEIYGDWQNDTLIREEDMGVMKHFNARACYPEAKRLCETMLATYKEEFGIQFCGVRLSHTLGPGIALDDGRAFAEFLRCALNGKDIILRSDGSAMRTYTYVADMVNAAFLILDRGGNEFYNVANQDNLISIRDLANLIARLPKTQKVNVKFSKEAEDMPYLPYRLAIMNTDKVRNLGWIPKVDIQRTFQWTFDSLLKN